MWWEWKTRDYQQKALYCYMNGKKTRERQTKTWMDNVRQDLAEKDMDLRTAVDTIRDRGR